jgi:hypothetical protein
MQQTDWIGHVRSVALQLDETSPCQWTLSAQGGGGGGGGGGDGESGKGSGSKRLVCRNRAAGRFSAPRGETLLLLPPRHSYTSTRARRHGEPRGIGSGCEIHSAREEGHDTNCIEYKTSARLLPLGSPARGCSGSKFFCAPGPAVQGRSSRASSPARPSLDLDHRLALCSL